MTKSNRLDSKFSMNSKNSSEFKYYSDRHRTSTYNLKSDYLNKSMSSYKSRHTDENTFSDEGGNECSIAKDKN